MPVLAVNIDVIGPTVQSVANEVVSAFERSEREPPTQQDPRLLREALDSFLAIARQVEAGGGNGPALTGPELSEVGAHGLTILDGLAEWTQRLELGQAPDNEIGRRLNRLYPSLAVWIARQGGQLMALEAVVNALAELANQTQDTDKLAELAGLAGEIVEASAPDLKQDLEKGNPGRPWRILNINRGIMATRAHDPEMMEMAFQALIRYLPEEAPRFFAEGMGQMEALDYPSEVQAVMQRYFDDWTSRTLH